jgi:ketosteroid isomerase-like protein
MNAFPRVEVRSRATPADQASAIDFVSRVNWLFETWDVDGMVDAFLPDGVAFHFQGVIRGREAMRRFFDDDYPYLIPGVSRHATNHIVDSDGDGVAVRYHNLLVRYATINDARELGSGKLHSETGLPSIWIYSPMLDRLRRVEGEWKILERYVGGSMTNRRLEPGDTEPAALTPFMPKLGAPLAESAGPQ